MNLDDALKQVLRKETPAGLAKVLLDLRAGRLVAVAVTDGDEEVPVPVDQYEQAVRTEMDRRLKKSRDHMGRGT